jgi:two-component system, NarL family, response regulator NreC
MPTILLADDHNIVRQGIRLILETQPGFEIVGEASDGLEALKLVEQLHPDVLIVDVMMTNLNGIEVVRQVKIISPQTRSVVLSMYDTEAYVVEALNAGVSAYILKKSTSDELVNAIRQVLSGNLYLSPPLNERAINAYIEHSNETRLDFLETLTAREREILFLAAEGLKNAEIAGRLSLSPRTVEMHRANLMHKLHLKSQSELLRFALQKGILPLEH